MCYHVLWLCMISFLTHCLASSICSSSPKQIVYMDRECDRVLKDDGLSEHDCYEVRSDKKTEGGLAQWQDKQHVEECSIAFDFGDRLIALVIEKWLCEITDTETYLNMSADCSGSHNQFMKQLNSSHRYPLAPVYSPGSCASLFFHRGSQNRTGGCHFTIKVIARFEPFPAFKISAIIVSSLVLLMLVVKVTCLLTGFERHLPNISENLSVNHDEHKFILNETSDHDIVQIQQPTEVDNPAHGSDADDARLGSPGLVASGNHNNRGHRLLSVSRSIGSETHCNASAADVDYFDMSMTPKLKRYPSAKASSIWTNK